MQRCNRGNSERVANAAASAAYPGAQKKKKKRNAALKLTHRAVLTGSWLGDMKNHGTEHLDAATIRRHCEGASLHFMSVNVLRRGCASIKTGEKVGVLGRTGRRREVGRGS